jgi:hypothetical protein
VFSNTKPPYVHKNLSEQLGARLPNLDIFLLSAWTGFEGGGQRRRAAQHTRTDRPHSQKRFQALWVVNQ